MQFHHADVSAALVHTVGLIGAHTVHAVQTSQQQMIIRCGITNMRILA